MPIQLQLWTDRYAELHGIKTPPESTEKTALDKAKAKEQPMSTPMRSYADLEKLRCYLCTRQFKTVAEVNTHELVSKVHKANTSNEQLVLKALTRMEKAGVPIRTLVAQEDQSTSDYRDRAQERRREYGSSAKVSKTEDEVDDYHAAPAPSKGASLLGKMGWSAGQGLGAQGSGRTAPIATDMYMPGVGLGAQGGKVGDATEEAERNTKGNYKDFLEKTKDKAKERYEKMA